MNNKTLIVRPMNNIVMHFGIVKQSVQKLKQKIFIEIFLYLILNENTSKVRKQGGTQWLMF